MATLVDAYALRLGRLRAMTVARGARQWDALGSYDDNDVEQLTDAVVPAVEAAQAKAAALTDAYLARELATRPLGIDPEQVTGAVVRAGTPPADVYRRSFITVWTALKNGASYESAVGAGRSRLTQTIGTDVQLAVRAAAHARLANDPHVVGYRRVLTGAKSCDLCTLATTQRYHRANLMPIHPDCDCAIVPIVGHRDRHVIAPALLARIKGVEAAGVAIRTVEHGELGPLLVNAAQHFEHL